MSKYFYKPNRHLYADGTERPISTPTATTTTTTNTGISTITAQGGIPSISTQTAPTAATQITERPSKVAPVTDTIITANRPATNGSILTPPISAATKPQTILPTAQQPNVTVTPIIIESPAIQGSSSGGGIFGGGGGSKSATNNSENKKENYVIKHKNLIIFSIFAISAIGYYYYQK